jgi:hypothetical protein
MPIDDEDAMHDAVMALLTDEQPAHEDLMWPPIVDDWTMKRYRVVEGDVIILDGIVIGRGGMPDGARMRSSNVVAIDSGRRWAKTANTLYRLRYRNQEKPLMLQSAAMYLLAALPDHSLV